MRDKNLLQQGGSFAVSLIVHFLASSTAPAEGSSLPHVAPYSVSSSEPAPHCSSSALAHALYLHPLIHMNMVRRRPLEFLPLSWPPSERLHLSALVIELLVVNMCSLLVPRSPIKLSRPIVLVVHHLLVELSVSSLLFIPPISHPPLIVRIVPIPRRSGVVVVSERS